MQRSRRDKTTCKLMGDKFFYPIVVFRLDKKTNSSLCFPRLLSNYHNLRKTPIPFEALHKKIGPLRCQKKSFLQG